MTQHDLGELRFDISSRLKDTLLIAACLVVVARKDARSRRKEGEEKRWDDRTVAAVLHIMYVFSRIDE
jgi:hypothetical protein